MDFESLVFSIYSWDSAGAEGKLRVLFYAILMKDLAICGCGCLWGSWSQPLMDAEGLL